MNYVESYYNMKKYLEENYLEKENYFPVYICSCGRWYTINDSLPNELKDCECGLKIGGKNEILEERDNHFAIYYDENQKNFIESGRASKANNKCKLNGKLLKDFKVEFIIEPIIKNCSKLGDLLLKNNEINDVNFSETFRNFVFLSQVYLEYIFDIVPENQKSEEFNNDINIFDEIKNLNTKIEEYLESKKISYSDFMNYFCDSYLDLLTNADCLKEKSKLYNLFDNLLKREYEEQDFNNIESNIITTLSYEPKFTNENLKYLLTATKYPNIEELKNYISLYKKRPLPILNTFVNIDQKHSDIEKLTHIENINDFINAFAEETNNEITRRNSESDTIKYYLDEFRNKLKNTDENSKSTLDIQFEAFCESYSQITNDLPLNITMDQPVKNILNDNKIKNKETAINKLYCHLIEIQNEYLKKIIENYNQNKDKLKEDIIIKNAIEQIQKEIPIQLATKADIFSFNVSTNVILSFEELFSFYSIKNIFNDKDDRIDYSNYSNIKFKLNMIEKELLNIILTGKKLFSEKQITYKFYLDPFEVEEKTKKFEKFTELYDRENLDDKEKQTLSKATENLKKIILPNLEILIFYLIKENKYQGKQKISEIKFHSNLYLNKNFIQLFSDSNNFTINKLVSIYEYMEEILWDFIADRYVNEEFKKRGFSKEYKAQLIEYCQNEDKRELKNKKLQSLLIKFICRYLPNESKEIESRDLFEMIREKNMNESELILKDLEDLKNKFGAKVKDTFDITSFLEINIRPSVPDPAKNPVPGQVPAPAPEPDQHQPDMPDDENNENEEEEEEENRHF
jgi:hypothetical protein